MWQYSSGLKDLLEPNVTNYILSCLSDMQNISPKEFETSYKVAENKLSGGRELDKLRFVCLTLHPLADDKQFKQGTEVLEQYIAEHPTSSPDDIQGLKILSDWKSLHKDKKELKAKVESLEERQKQDQVLIGELHKQIEQLKNIEIIIKSRKDEQP